jgi:hypothetical protein
MSMMTSNLKQRLPNFIIIGAMKSATSTLHEQLARQPGISMCDPKEPNFFGDDANYAKGLSWYAGLFSAGPAGALLGEASTHYTKFPTYPHVVARMHEQLPNVRLVYVMRHPIDRLISHYIHEWSMRSIDCEIDEAIARYPEMIAYGQYAMQLDAYFEAYGRAAVLPVFFDHLSREPQAELERVCRFIGYKGVPHWLHNLKPDNVSSERVRRFPLFELVVDSAPATSLRRALIPKSWRNWVRARLTMRQRPVVSQDTRAALEAEFDRDLSRLGEWLGKPLCCENFKQVTGSVTLNWATVRV